MAEEARLESVCTPKGYREFESRSLRKETEAQRVALGFFAIRPSASSLAGGRVAKKGPAVPRPGELPLPSVRFFEHGPPGRGRDSASRISGAAESRLRRRRARCRSEATKSRMA